MCVVYAVSANGGIFDMGANSGGGGLADLVAMVMHW